MVPVSIVDQTKIKTSHRAVPLFQTAQSILLIFFVYRQKWTSISPFVSIYSLYARQIIVLHVSSVRTSLLFVCSFDVSPRIGPFSYEKIF